MLNCKICNIECLDYHALSTHVYFKHKLKAKDYYDQYIKTQNDGHCLVCGKETKFLSLSNGYRTYCCGKCTQQSAITKEKIKSKNREKYGTDYYSQTKEWLNSVIDTNNNKFGCDFAGQNNDVKNKIKNTNLKKYGVTTYSQTDECKNRVKQTVLNNFGVEYLQQNPEIHKKSVETCLSKYGVSNVSQNDIIQEKKKSTNLLKYGVEWYNNHEKSVETITNKSHFGSNTEYVVLI